MHYFLDTNVLIADIFSLDPLHKYSIKFFLGDGKYYFSENVRIECEDIFQRKLNDYYNFFSELYFQFNSNAKKYVSHFIGEDMVNVEILHHFVNNINHSEFSKKDMHRVLNTFIKDVNLDYHEPINKINSILSEFLHELQFKSRESKDELLNNLFKIPVHKNYYHSIEAVILNNSLPIHSKDKKILLDAHEFSCNNQDISLFFVTGDEDFYISINFLLELLCIEKGFYLKDFS